MIGTKFENHRSWPAWIPIVGIVVFVILYLVAAALYPGGTRADPTTRGYSHFSNYLCDLLDPVSYSGAPNRGFRYALMAMFVLPLSLISFWIRLPMFFPARRWARRVVPIAGSLAMCISTLIFTHWHNWAVRLAGALGFSAFGTAVVALVRAGRSGLAMLGAVPLGLGLIDFVFWQGGCLPSIAPALQKAAYASFFIWVAACVFRTSECL